MFVYYKDSTLLISDGTSDADFIPLSEFIDLVKLYLVESYYHGSLTNHPLTALDSKPMTYKDARFRLYFGFPSKGVVTVATVVTL